jgi:hypothetical protein
MSKQPILGGTLIRVQRQDYHPLRRLLGYSQEFLLFCSISGNVDSKDALDLGKTRTRNVLYVGSDIKNNDSKICLCEPGDGDVYIFILATYRSSVAID